MEDQQLAYIRKWLSRSQESQDQFDSFIYCWIALVIAAQRHRTYHGSYRHDNNDWDTDRDKVIEYFKYHMDRILLILYRYRNNMQELAARRGSLYGNPIVDTGNRQLREKFRLLSQHYLADIELPGDLLVEYVAELFNKVRNNLFHGQKVYDDADDRAIISWISPILIEIINTCEIKLTGK